VKLPEDEQERMALYRKLIDQCFISKEERKNFYASMRMMYLFGSEIGILKDGQINKAQAAKLHKEDHQIRQEERDMASQNHGHITKQEQVTLNQQENAVSRQIGK